MTPLLADAGSPGSALTACRRYFVWSGVFSAVINLLYLSPTLYMMQVYDRVIPTAGLPTLAFLTGIAVLALATLSWLDWMRGRLLVKAGLRFEDSLRAPLLERVVGHPKPGDDSSPLRDFDTLRTLISSQACTAMFDTPWTPIYLAAAFFLHPAIGVLTLAGSGLLVGLALLNEKSTRPPLRDATKQQGRVHKFQDTLTRNEEVVRALGMQKTLTERLAAQRQSAARSNARGLFAGGLFSSGIKFARLALQAASLALAAWLAVKGDISPGSIIASSILLGRAVAPVEQLVGAWPSLVQARTAWGSLSRFFETPHQLRAHRTALPPPQAWVTLKNVSVRLPGSDTFQLTRIELEFQPGDIVGLTGPSGSGKTTLARVLAGAIPASSGTVRLDGATYAQRTNDDLGRWIGYLPQAPGLLDGSVRDNIARFRSRSDPSVDLAVIAAAQAAGAHEMILRLPKGYDTFLPDGAGLSAGQGQRVALARALYGDPVLLVLDEPDSNLDRAGQTALLRAIRRAAHRGATVVVSAHRSAVLDEVHRIVDLSDGRIRKDSTRESAPQPPPASTTPSKPEQTLALPVTENDRSDRGQRTMDCS